MGEWLQARAETEEAAEMRRAESRWQVEAGEEVASLTLRQRWKQAGMKHGGGATGLPVPSGVARLVCEITGQEGLRGCGWRGKAGRFFFPRVETFYMNFYNPDRGCFWWNGSGIIDQLQHRSHEVTKHANKNS